jgi:hypothetical protein
MADSGETNELLREIRDLLNGQEARYEKHRIETKKLYDEQLARMRAMERRRTVVAAVLVGCLIAFGLFACK